MDKMSNGSYKKEIQIEELLSKSEGLDENQKDFFRALAGTVIDRQNDFFKNIEKNILFQGIEEEKKIPYVATWLKTSDDSSDGTFTPMLDNDENDNNIIFLDVPYDKIKDYNKSQKNLKLEQTDVFVKKEKMVSSLFRLYNISCPYIYSPYSRRAFKLFELNEKTNEYEPLNLKTSDYDLSEIPGAIQGELMWNLSISYADQLSPKKITVNDEVFYRYKREKDSFIIPASEYDELFLDDALVKISEDHVDLKSDLNLNITEIKINENNVRRDQPVFSTEPLNENLIIPANIYTKADIKLAVEAFYFYPDEYKGYYCALNNENKTIKDYERDYRYNYNGLSEISRKNKNFCYLKFENSRRDNFFEDRVNYFIAFMRYRYPNFYWVGVYA